MPPLVPALSIETGYFLRNGCFLTHFTMQTLGYEVHQRLLDYALGSFVVGPLLAVLVGMIMYLIARFFTRAPRRGAKPRRPSRKPGSATGGVLPCRGEVKLVVKGCGKRAS